MTRTVVDVLTISLPKLVTEEILQDPELRDAMFETLEIRAWDAIWSQWPRLAPFALRETHIDWTIVHTLDEIDAFVPAHDCENCRMNQVKAREFLEKHPGRFIAMGNVTYVPIWVH